jgi:hypothetical protein
VRVALTAALVASVAFTAVAATPRAAAAAVTCPVPAGASPRLGDVDGETRLRWIDGHLTLRARHAVTWKWAVVGGLGAATVLNVAPIFIVAPANRIDWYTGAVTTVIGVVPVLVAPLKVIEDAHELSAAIAAAPPGADVCPLLADAEVRLARDAQNQADGQRWWLHVGNAALNIGVGLFLGFGFHHWLAGAFNTISGAALGEVILLTQPTGSIDDLQRYRSADLDAGAPPRRLSLAFSARF